MPIITRLWQILDVPHPGDRVSLIFDLSMLSLILLNVLAVVLGSMESIQAQYGLFLQRFELISVIIFSIEYAARIWSCTTSPDYEGPVTGRIRLMVTPLMVIDLIALLPFYLSFGMDLRSIRAFRLLRILRLAKLGRYVPALRLIGAVFTSKREELLITTLVMILILVITASIMHEIEHAVQPDVFPDIPSAMWWAVATLTTVGYGDAYPVTGLGRVLAGVVAVVGIALFALPTGILASGFSEALEKRKESKTCPHCGKEIV